MFFRSLIEKSKDKLDLVVRRSGEKLSNGMSGAHHINTNGDIPGKHNYAPQNLFVQPASNGVDVKNNLTRFGLKSSKFVNIQTKLEIFFYPSELFIQVIP